MAAARIGLHPTVLTLINMVIGTATAAALIVAAPAIPDLSGPGRLALAAAVWAGLQIAYCLDCGDGQLARVTGQTSPAGGTVDILCDIVVQATFIAALAAVAGAYTALPAWAPALWGAVWLLTLVTSQLDKGGDDVSLIRSASWPVRIVKLVRDYGAQISAAAIVFAAWPEATAALLWGLTAVNGTYLLVLIARTSRTSLTANS